MEEEFHQTLKRLRLKAGLSRRELAKKVGVSEISIIRWEDKGVIPHTVNLFKLCSVFPAHHFYRIEFPE